MIDWVFFWDNLFKLFKLEDSLVIGDLFCFVGLLIRFIFGFDFFFFEIIFILFGIEFCLFDCDVVDFIEELCVGIFNDDEFVLFVMWFLIVLFVVFIFVFEWEFDFFMLFLEERVDI